MAKYIVEDTSLIAVADAIRAKTGKSDPLTLAQMPTEIGSIESGGSSGEKTALAEFLEGTSTEITAEDLQGCTSIRDYAGIDGYNACFSNLTSVTIPASVTYIGEYAISIGGISITLLSETPPTIDTNAFGYNEFSSGFILPCTIYVPASAVDIYKTATNWSLYADWIQAIEEGDNGGSTDQTAFAGAYTADGTFSNREYTWDEMVANADSSIYPYVSLEKEFIDITTTEHDIVVPDSALVVTEDSYTSYYEISLVNMGGNDVILPKNTTNISSWARDPIGTIYIKTTKPPILDSPFEVEVERIVVPYGCDDAYKSATNWSIHANIIEEGEMPI